MSELLVVLQALVATAIFFVWVVRYDNIVKEFESYRYPNWLRDLVGILKLTFAVLLIIGIGRPQFAVIGGVGIALLMVCAVATHVRVKNPLQKMAPSMTLLALAAVIAVLNNS